MLLQVRFTYPYLATASVNSAYRRGCAKFGFKDEVAEWRQGLTLLFKNRLQHLDREFEPPVQLMFQLHSRKRSGAIDAGNFAKIIEDSIFSALEFDDNDLHLIRGPYTGVRTTKTPYFSIVIKEIRESVYDEDTEIFFRRPLEIGTLQGDQRSSVVV